MNQIEVAIDQNIECVERTKKFDPETVFINVPDSRSHILSEISNGRTCAVMQRYLPTFCINYTEKRGESYCRTQSISFQ